ncbi:MAG: hypothetical protein ACYCVB_17565, partial [Bacilli bacterium]
MNHAVTKVFAALTALSALVLSQTLASGVPVVPSVPAAYMIEKLATLLPTPAPNAISPDPYWDVQAAGPTLWNDVAFMQDNGWLSASVHAGTYTFGANSVMGRHAAAVLVAHMFGVADAAQAYGLLDKIGAFRGVSQNRAGFTASGAARFVRNVGAYAKRHGWRVALSAQGKADLKNPALATQAGLAAGLFNTFSRLPVWPKSLSMSAPFSARSWIPPSPLAWVGLRAVFPGQPSSRYAALLGLTAAHPTAPATAGQAALWISRWAVIARKINLQTSVSQNPFAWAKTFSLFHGTDVQSPATVLTTADAQRILSNLVDSARGFRILGANRIAFLAPIVTLGKPGTVPNSLYSTAVAVLRQLQAHAHTGRTYTWSDWPGLYKDAVEIQNSTQVTLTQNGALYSRRTSSRYGVGSDFQWVSSAGVVTGEWNQSMTAINSGNPRAVFGLHYPVAIQSHIFYDGASTVSGALPQIPGAQILNYTSDPFSSATSPYFGFILRGPNY